ncbi:hypothetical protein niasHT_039911 [Heterodera trifolii]|uniref:Uncharacterized protein n=1 Tax=Heterodera trifolii TaxID=157864 RepID=A0ABD2IBD6_9BILA
MLLLLFSGCSLYGDQRFRLAGNKPNSSNRSGANKKFASDELHQTHLAQPGTPKKDIVMDQPELHLTPSLHPSPPPPRGKVPIADEILPQPQFIYNTTTTYSFYEHLTRAGQSVWELIAHFFRHIVSMPIKFAKMVAHFVKAVPSSVWLSLKWLAEQIVGLPFTFVASLKEAVQFRMQNIANSVTEFGKTVYRKGKKFKGMRGPTTPTIDGNALKDNLRKVLDLKLRVETEEINKTVNHFEEQIMTNNRRRFATNLTKPHCSKR